MDRVIRSSIHKARKDYTCDACFWWNRSGLSINDCVTEEQKQAVITAEQNKWKINKGQEYRKVIGIQDGELVTFKAGVDMDDVCYQLEVYPDD